MKKILLASITSLVLSSPLIADVNLAKSYPKNGAMFMQSPEKIQLKFTDKVSLKSIRLFDATGNVSVLSTGDGSRNSFFSAPMMALNKGNYRVAWSAEGEEGNTENGTFDFMIH
jgi:methionine-rich copper-binding protein CopC